MPLFRIIEVNNELAAGVMDFIWDPFSVNEAENLDSSCKGCRVSRMEDVC